MRHKVAFRIFFAAAALLLAVSAYGQEAAPSDEARIRQLRDAVGAMAENAPPAGSSLEGDFVGALQRVRGQLHDALLERNGALKQSIRNLQSRANVPEVQGYVRRLSEEQQRVEEEIQGLKRDLAGAPPASAPAPPMPVTAINVPAPKPGQPPPTPDPTPQPPTKQEREAFEGAVANFTPDKLAEAVSPAAAEGTSTAPTCLDVQPPALPFAAGSSLLEQNICRLASDLARDRRRVLLSQDEGPLLTLLIAKLLKTESGASYAAFVTEAQERRTDQQMGSSPASEGTTSLVSKGGIPYAFGFAVEHGAATRTQSDTTVTFRVNPAGLLGLMTDKGFITGFRESERDPLLKFLRKTSVGFTFDTTRGDQPGVFTGDRQQLSEVSARIEFVNDRDPRHLKYARMWEEFVADEGVRLARQIWATSKIVLPESWGDRTHDIPFRDPALQAWLEQTNRLINASGFRVGEVESIIRRQFELLPVGAVSQETVGAVADFARSFQRYTQRKNALLDQIAKGNVFTLDYTNKREVNAPDTSNFTFIAAKGMQSGGRTLDFTANGSLTFFHSRPTPAKPTDPAPGRVRDFQFAGQLDVPFKVGDVGQFVLWFSGRYERLLEDASAPGGATVAGTKGDIAVGQFGLKVPMPGTGLQLPLSFTFANRTELVKEKEVRGNFGFTLNFDSILSRFKPF